MNKALKSEKELMEGWKNKRDLKVSVACICFNHEKYIKQAIESFLMQETDFAFEIIIHDDASTDSSRKIIEDYANKYPTIINAVYQIDNMFKKDAYNIFKVPFSYCKGEYIAICEGDDFWVSTDKLQKQVTFLDANRSVQLVFHDSNIVDENSILLSASPLKIANEHKFSTKNIIHDWFIPTQTIMFRNTIPNDDFHKFKNVINLDWALQLMCSIQGDIVYLSGLKASYRKHSAGVSSTFLKNINNRTLKLLLLMDSFDSFSNYRFSKSILFKKNKILEEFYELKERDKYGSCIFFLLRPKLFISKIVAFLIRKVKLIRL